MTGGMSGPGLVRFIPYFFHHGDGQRARAHDVGYRTARDRTHEPGGQHGDFGRTAAGPTGNGVGEVNEELAKSSRLEISTKEDKEEDERRRDAQRNAKNAFRREIEMAHELVQRQSAVCEHARHIRPGKSIREEKEHDTNHRQPYDTARSLNDEYDT